MNGTPMVRVILRLYSSEESTDRHGGGCVCGRLTRDAQYGRDAAPGVSAVPDCAQCGERAARYGKARVRRLGELRRLALETRRHSARSQARLGRLGLLPPVVHLLVAILFSLRVL